MAIPALQQGEACFVSERYPSLTVVYVEAQPVMRRGPNGLDVIDHWLPEQPIQFQGGYFVTADVNQINFIRSKLQLGLIQGCREIPPDEINKVRATQVLAEALASRPADQVLGVLQQLETVPRTSDPVANTLQGQEQFTTVPVDVMDPLNVNTRPVDDVVE